MKRLGNIFTNEWKYNRETGVAFGETTFRLSVGLKDRVSKPERTTRFVVQSIQSPFVLLRLYYMKNKRGFAKQKRPTCKVGLKSYVSSEKLKNLQGGVFLF